jgi:hypothetical protein
MDLMVSVLILGLFLVPLAISRNNIILMAGQTISLRKARVLAVQKLGELELTPLEELSDASGDFGEENPGYFWETKVETIAIEDVLDLGAAEEEEEGGFPSPEEAEEEAPAHELVRLTLVVRAPGGADTDEEAADEWGEEKKLRTGDRIHVVRYFLKEPEPEEGEGGLGN